MISPEVKLKVKWAYVQNEAFILKSNKLINLVGKLNIYAWMVEADNQKSIKLQAQHEKQASEREREWESRIFEYVRLIYTLRQKATSKKLYHHENSEVSWVWNFFVR